MNLFHVVFNEVIPPDVLSKANMLYGTGHIYSLTPYSFLIRGWDQDPKVISDKLSLSQHRSIVVFRLSGFYWGYHDKALWNWLQETRSASV